VKSWYYAKEPHERQIIIVIGIILAIALFYLLVWSPITEGYANKKTQVTAQRELLNWVQATGDKIKRLQGSGQQSKAGSEGPLLSTVDRTIKSSRLGSSMKRLEPQGENKVQIWFENTDFDALVDWLGKLANEYQIHVNTINIDRQDAPGQVNARVVLTTGI